MIIDIPVKLVCPGCVDCPNIEIESEQFMFGNLDTSWNQNKFYCKSYTKCAMIQSFLIKEEKKRNEQGKDS